MNRRFGWNSVTLICRPVKARRGAEPEGQTCKSTKLSIQSKAASAAAVANVSHKPQRYAAAANTKKKNKKNGGRGLPEKTERRAGKRKSPGCRRKQKARGDGCRRRTATRI